MIFKKNERIKILFPLIFLVLLIVLPLIFDHHFFKHVMIMIFFYATLSEAWNILGGYVGQISLGNAIFFGVGAYTSSMLLLHYNVSPWIGLLIGGLLAVLLAIVIGMPIFKLRAQYFVIATLCLGEAIRIISQNVKFIGGQTGLELPLVDSLKNMTFLSNNIGFYYISLAILSFCIIFIYILLNSKLGYYFKMIRTEEDVANSLGIDVRLYKLVAISLMAFITAIVGSCYAQYFLYIEPNMVFALEMSEKIALISVLGGVGTIWGPTIGAFILIPIIEISRIYFGGLGRGIDLFLYGFLMLIIILFKPEGIVTIFKRNTRS